MDNLRQPLIMDQDIDPIDIENIRDSHSSSMPSDPGSERHAQVYQSNSPNRSFDLGPDLPLEIVQPIDL